MKKYIIVGICVVLAFCLSMVGFMLWTQSHQTAVPTLQQTQSESQVDTVNPEANQTAGNASLAGETEEEFWQVSGSVVKIIANISTIMAALLASAALFLMFFSNSPLVVERSVTWLKIIAFLWVAIMAFAGVSALF